MTDTEIERPSKRYCAIARPLSVSVPTSAPLLAPAPIDLTRPAIKAAALDIQHLLRDPFPQGSVGIPFTVTKPRLMNLHKLLPGLMTLGHTKLTALITESARCGALDSVVFMRVECHVPVVKAQSKAETTFSPGTLVFLHQLFPEAGFDKFTPCGDWRFPVFGGGAQTLKDAIEQKDPLRLIKLLLYCPTVPEFLSCDVHEVLKAIPLDEMRHFFLRLLQDFMTETERKMHGPVYGGVFDKQGHVIPERLPNEEDDDM